MVWDIFSKRAKRAAGPVDVFQYLNFPVNIRVQVVHLWLRTIGEGGEYSESKGVYWHALKALHEEYGVFHLCPNKDYLRGREELIEFFINIADILQCMDCIELVMFWVGTRFCDNQNLDAENASTILNQRLREAGIGFQYESGNIIKVSDLFTHAEVTIPALSLLKDPVFAVANGEFLSAHSKFRSNDFSGCLVEALKSLESTLKIIFSKKDWSYSNESFSGLLAIAYARGLIPAYLQSHFGALKSLLESGAPTTRNKTAGHGQGPNPIIIPEHLASFMLHTTASTIIFFVNSYKHLP